MEEFAKSLWESFEELFRYFYPGLLFIAFCRLAEIRWTKIETNILGSSYEIWSLIAISFLLSFIIYNLQRYLLHEYILLILFALGITAPAALGRKNRKFLIWAKVLFFIIVAFTVLYVLLYLILEVYLIPVWVIGVINIGSIISLIWASDYLNSYRTFIRKRFESKTDFNKYIGIRWATTHAIGITWWVPLLLYKYGLKFTCKNGFIFKHWEGFCIVIGMIFVTWLYQVISLSIVEREFLNPRYAREIWEI